MSRNRCSSCGYMLVKGLGDPNSPELVLRDYPDFEEQKAGQHMPSGPSGQILQQEFGVARMPLSQCYVTFLYPHIHSDDCEFNYLDEAATLFKGREKVLLLGSGAVEPFFNRKAIDLCGVWQKHVAFPGVKFMPCISPATVLKSDLGELRLALSRFSK